MVHWFKPTMSLESLLEQVPVYEWHYGFTPAGNPFVFVSNLVCLGLTRGEYCIIDAQDFLLISNYRWHVHKNRGNLYAISQTGGKALKMHRLLLGNSSKIIDHINRNGLDNRRTNLREADEFINTRNHRLRKDNSSGYSCVYKTGKKYRAEVKVRGKKYHLGYFDTAEQANVAVIALDRDRPPREEGDR